MPETGAIQISAVHTRAALYLKSWDLAHEVAPRADLPSFTQGRWLTLGPGEWLVTSDTVRPSALYERVADDARRRGIAIVDLSDGLSVIQLTGKGSRETLTQGCGLDLHPNVFPVATCARTRLAQLSVIIDHVNGLPTFDLYVASSHFYHLQSWVRDACSSVA
jgi:sarcosine oxidase, subunit gamma